MANTSYPTEFNIGQLKKFLRECDLSDDTPVFVSCQGYTNYDFSAQKLYQDSTTLIVVREGKLFFTDNCIGLLEEHFNNQ